MGHLDRKKHDVDVIERVLGGVRDDEAFETTRVFNVEVPWYGGSTETTVELTVGLPSEMRDDRSRRR